MMIVGAGVAMLLVFICVMTIFLYFEKSEAEINRRMEGTRERILTDIELGKLNDLDDAGRTPLMRASLNNLSDVAENLVHRGVDLNSGDGLGKTALHYAARTSNVDLVKILVENGAYIDALDLRSNTPLHTAIMWKNEEVIEYLIKSGAKLDIQDNVNGLSPLMLAAMNGSYNVVSDLLNRGADPRLRSRRNKTAQQLAEEQILKMVGKNTEVNHHIYEMVNQLKAFEKGIEYHRKEYSFKEDNDYGLLISGL